MSLQYSLAIYTVHSALETAKSCLTIDEKTTVDNFQENETNKKVCLRIFRWLSDKFGYEISWYQMNSGIHLFLSNHKTLTKIKEE